MRIFNSNSIPELIKYPFRFEPLIWLEKVQLPSSKISYTVAYCTEKMYINETEHSRLARQALRTRPKIFRPWRHPLTSRRLRPRMSKLNQVLNAFSWFYIC